MTNNLLEHDCIYNISCLDGLRQLPDCSLDMTISSPPYNVGILYATHDDNMAWDQYDKFMAQVLKELFRVTKDGGRIAWNIPSFSSRQNLYERFLKLFRDAGFLQYTEIIWNKKQISARTAWGSWLSPSQPYILGSWEYILIFYKNKKNHGKGSSDITKEEFVPWTNGMWEFRPETNSKHPAPFPVELPRRLLKFFTYPGDLICDPFMGSGTTALAALQTKRHYIGFELDAAYHKMAEERIKNGK